LDLREGKGWEAREDCIIRNFITCMLHQILLYDEMEKDAVGGTCRMHEKCI